LERDLSRPDIWEQSLERSRARRGRTGGRFTRPAPAAGGKALLRDLADPELWDLSRVRSRTRHDAADPTFTFPARGASIAALLAVTGGSAAAIASTVGGGGGKAATAATPKPRRHAASLAAAPIERGRPAQVAEKPAPTRHSTPSKSAVVKTAATVTAKPRAGGVPELQRALGVPVDGDFGPTTQKALKRWQRAHGLTPDGVAGPQTRAALDLGTGSVLKRQVLRRHASRAHTRTHHTKPAVVAAKAAPRRAGGGVRALQQALGVPADGVFGSGTQHALKRYQRAHGLTPDGVAGPQTRSALDLGSGPVLKRKAVPHHHSSGGGSGGGGGGGGGSSSVVARVIAAANAIAGTPYVYGGGHGSFSSSGYDCSGSVSYALHGGGLLSAPLTSGAFMSYGAPGPGQHITIYANAGHVYMTIDGRRYDTSARSETGSRWTGTQRSSAGYVVRHPPGY
jgi:peptidoglycan hydrolase-like protein with peptidoglycan-binding domain